MVSLKQLAFDVSAVISLMTNILAFLVCLAGFLRTLNTETKNSNSVHRTCTPLGNLI